MKNIYIRKELWIGSIVWVIFLLIFYIGPEYSKILENLALITIALFFSIPFTLGVWSVNLFSDAEFSNFVLIVAVLLNSYLIAIAINKLLIGKARYSKWLIYGLYYIGINIAVFILIWFLFVLPGLQNFLSVFLKIITGK